MDPSQATVDPVAPASVAGSRKRKAQEPKQPKQPKQQKEPKQPKQEQVVVNEGEKDAVAVSAPDAKSSVKRKRQPKKTSAEKQEEEKVVEQAAPVAAPVAADADADVDSQAPPKKRARRSKKAVAAAAAEQQKAPVLEIHPDTVAINQPPADGKYKYQLMKETENKEGFFNTPLLMSLPNTYTTKRSNNHEAAAKKAVTMILSKKKKSATPGEPEVNEVDKVILRDVNTGRIFVYSGQRKRFDTPKVFFRSHKDKSIPPTEIQVHYDVSVQLKNDKEENYVELHQRGKGYRFRHGLVPSALTSAAPAPAVISEEEISS